VNSEPRRRRDHVTQGLRRHQWCGEESTLHAVLVWKCIDGAETPCKILRGGAALEKVQGLPRLRSALAGAASRSTGPHCGTVCHQHCVTATSRFSHGCQEGL